MRAVAFSDPACIELINRSFIPLELNLNQRGFPSELPGLQRWQSLYEQSWRYERAFATSMVLGSGGRMPLATSGWGHRWQIATASGQVFKAVILLIVLDQR